jgi:transcriptional regulator with XRE-family HTH domain
VSNGDYSRALGDRLRKIRIQKNMSLQDVQQASEGRWKAAVVGAYERGDRNVTVTKLAELAEFYGVPVSEIIPEDDGPTAPGEIGRRKRLVLDLESLENVPMEDRDPISRRLQRPCLDYPRGRPDRTLTLVPNLGRRTSAPARNLGMPRSQGLTS